MGHPESHELRHSPQPIRMTPPGPRAELPRDSEWLPPLPASFWTTLDAGLPALGLTLAPEARRAIDVHVRLLLAWNEAINLTSIIEPGAVASRHVLDSLAAVSLLSDREAAGDGSGIGGAGASAAIRLVDIGSGGGFPGLPLAAAIPAIDVTLVDSIAKKARFLEVASAAMALGDRVVVRAERAEALVSTPAAGAAGHEAASWDVVTARAIGRLDELVELAMPLLNVGGRLLAWKRGDIEAELAAADRAAPALGAGHPLVHLLTGIPDLAGHQIVELVKLRPTPDGYPRDPPRRKGRPW